MIFPIVQPVVYRGTVSDLRVSAVDDTAFVDNLDITLGDHISSSWESLASGSVTQANSRISAVDGTAFYDFGSGTNLTDNLGKYLIIKDSTGKAIKGWIKAAGSGETLGSELFPALDNPANFTNVDASWTIGEGNAVSNGIGFFHKTFVVSVYALCFTSMDIVSRSNGTIYHPYSGQGIEQAGTSGTGVKTRYRTWPSTNCYIYGDGSGGGFIGTLTDISLKQVLTPSSTGVTITSTKNGTTYNWESQETGFNYNDASGYTYEVFDRDFTALVGGTHLVEIYDSTGKAIAGVLGEQGTGETLGSEAITAVANGSTTYAFETLTINANGRDIDSAINTTGSGFAYSNTFGSVGGLYKTICDITLNTGTSPDLYTKKSTGSINTAIKMALVDGDYYRTWATVGSNTDNGICIYLTNKTSDLSLTWSSKQVLTPSVQGCTIVSSKGGATERFKRIDTGFLFNSSSYTVIIKKLRKLYPFNIPDEEVHELWKLYSLGGGASWTNKTGWFTDLDVENWHGITLSGGRVQKIEIPSNNGTGNISSFQPGVFTSMTNLSLSINSFSGDLSSWVLPSSMTVLSLYTNSFSGDLSSWVLPSNMIYLYLYTNSFSGDLSSWVLPSSMIYLSLSINSFSGDLSSWVLPSSMTVLSLYTNSFLGVPDISSNTAMRNYQYYSNGLLTATVDAIIDGIWARRMSFTYTTPIILQIGGTNQAATGTEQNVCPPTTPKEKIYQLENDGCAEGFKKWAITNN